MIIKPTTPNTTDTQTTETTPATPGAPSQQDVEQFAEALGPNPSADDVNTLFQKAEEQAEKQFAEAKAQYEGLTDAQKKELADAQAKIGKSMPDTTEQDEQIKQIIKDAAQGGKIG